MKKPFLLIAFLVIVIISLFGVRAVVSNKLSTSGVELGQAQDDIKRIRTENTIIKEKLYKMSSLTHVSSAAARLGFVESKESYALIKAQPIALNQ